MIHSGGRRVRWMACGTLEAVLSVPGTPDVIKHLLADGVKLEIAAAPVPKSCARFAI